MISQFFETHHAPNTVGQLRVQATSCTSEPFS